jgi:hypothetical protein
MLGHLLCVIRWPHRPNSYQNGAACKDLHRTFECLCIAGYNGTRCEQLDAVDDCVATAGAQTPCLNGGACTDHFAGFGCECRVGFGGELCSQVLPAADACAAGPCQHGARCVNEPVGDYRCECTEPRCASREPCGP